MGAPRPHVRRDARVLRYPIGEVRGSHERGNGHGTPHTTSHGTAPARPVTHCLRAQGLDK